jgi:putative flavoprotein involved in K+ transport
MRTDVVIVGGGQAGLAMSRCLTDRRIDHVVLERGRVAERWRSERWDSLTLLTPNWQSRLPGFRYEGPDPDGYMTMPDVIGFLERYAASFRAPVRTGIEVVSVRHAPGGYRVETTGGLWQARSVVIATGYCDLPAIPGIGRHLPGDIHQLVPGRYRNPGALPPGGVLVVGASASGIQLADEIRQAGREVTIAVGRHTRLPRRYRGRDILWWLDAMGVLDESVDQVFDIDISRHQPALQLVGRQDHGSIDLGRLQDAGVRVVGRAVAADGHRMSFDDDLIATTVAADVKLAVLRQRIDAFMEQSGVSGLEPAEPFAPLWPRFSRATAPLTLDLHAEGIGTVVWATGFRRAYPWLAVPVLDAHGEIRHTSGVTPVPGLYVLGLQFQRRRKSAFIDGVGGDAEYLAGEIERLLKTRRPHAEGTRPCLQPQS